MKKSHALALSAVVAVFTWLGPRQAWAGQAAVGNLEQHFTHPPPEFRPWVYWFWLNGNITSNGVTADLEAMQRAGIGGVLIMEVDQGAPKGPADFGGAQWRALFKHVCSEAHRLGLEVNMNNDAGWCGSGGPWITPELAMQKLTSSETNLVGPVRFDGQLPTPATVMNFYQDIAVFAFPTPGQDTRIDNLPAKGAFLPQRVAPRADFAEAGADSVVPRDKILNLTPRLAGTNGHLAWEVPAGKWTVLRLGHTLTGKDNHPAPTPGRGLESDKLSRAATDIMFAGLMGKIIADSKPLAGNTLVATHIDSWETGSQNWTPRFREDFKRLRGYDPLPLLPVIAGHIVDSREVSERFLWDIRQTVSDLIVKNYAGRFRELAHKNGMRLSIEAYDGAPCDEMTYAGQADEPMAEFWSWGYNTAYSCTEMASAAHIYGKPILGAEAFTANDGERWLHHPATIKTLGDWAFCEGINRFVFHRYALQPWLNVAPGMSMGPWGLHYERTQTWWEQSKAWHEYLARCQYLLRQGVFVADVCYLQPEGSPQRFTLPLPGRSANTPDRPAYNFDGCTPEVVIEKMKVKGGKLVLPSGMSYELLVLPQVDSMTPRLLAKISDLVKAGATVVGARPRVSPSLSDYPECDREVKELAAQLWGKAEGTKTGERKFGKGRVIPVVNVDGQKGAPEEQTPFVRSKWIWHPEGNPAVSAPVGTRYFRRTITLENRPIVSARLAITVDNSFEVWINGQRAGGGDDFNEAFKFNVAALLKPGTNLIAVAAENASDKPNPAGLIAALTIQFADGQVMQVASDRQWRSSPTTFERWNSETVTPRGWAKAMELGSVGMAPWNVPGKAKLAEYSFPPLETINGIMAGMRVARDFESDAGWRYIHRREGELDIYFVANPETNWIGATCAFRVNGKMPELWQPLTGQIRQPAVYEQRDGRTWLPIWLEPAGSVFVVFRKSAHSQATDSGIVSVERGGKNVLPSPGNPEMARPAIELSANAQPDGKTGVKALVWESGAYNFRRASGLAGKLEVPALPPPWELSGAWEVHFQPNRGAPEKITMDGPSDWAKNPDPGIQHFSGTATYVKTFTVPEQMLEARQKFPLTPALSPGRGGNAGSPTANEGKGGSTMPARLRLNLDLGRVAVMAEVKVNGQDFGIWWKPPFRADITEALKPGENRLEIKVVNLWINRMIGDEQLAEDSARNPNGTLKEWPQWVNEGKSSPTGRSTFTSWRLWKKDSPLQESGLLGPVRLVSAWEETIGSEPRQHAGRGTGEAAKAPNSNIQHPDKLQAPRSKNQNSEAKGNVWPSFTTSTHYE